MYCWEIDVCASFPSLSIPPDSAPNFNPWEGRYPKSDCSWLFLLSNLKKSPVLLRGYLYTNPFSQESTLQQSEAPFPCQRPSFREMRVFKNIHLELPTFLWESSYYLKNGLSLPPPDEAVNCNKRIWLNKFPIQTLSCGQRTLSI